MHLWWKTTLLLGTIFWCSPLSLFSWCSSTSISSAALPLFHCAFEYKECPFNLLNNCWFLVEYDKNKSNQKWICCYTLCRTLSYDHQQLIKEKYLLEFVFNYLVIYWNNWPNHIVLVIGLDLRKICNLTTPYLILKRSGSVISTPQ